MSGATLALFDYIYYILFAGGCASMAITKAQAKATAKYKAKHPEAAKAYQARSYARRYIKQYADNEGLDELEKLIHIRREELNKQ